LIVDLENKQLHCLRQPTGAVYSSVISVSPPARVAVAALPQIRLELAALFQ